jgi:hypothetical protein
MVNGGHGFLLEWQEATGSFSYLSGQDKTECQKAKKQPVGCFSFAWEDWD